MTKTEVFEIVRNNILEVLEVEPDTYTIEDSLPDLGADSVDRVEIVTMSMEDLGVAIPLMSFAVVSNIQGLVDVLHANVGE